VGAADPLELHQRVRSGKLVTGVVCGFLQLETIRRRSVDEIKRGLYARSLAGLEFSKSTHSSQYDDPPDCVEVAQFPDGARVLRDSANPTGADVRFTSTEWAAFITGAQDGEF
jgi:hypothetical protein